MSPAQNRFRFLYAYAVTFQILLSYFFLFALRKFLGEARIASLTQRTHIKNTRRILKGILYLKGLFIKIGQMLSLMTTLLPPEMTSELEQLQDAVPPHPYQEIEKRFFQEFQLSPKALFSSFETTPLASASLGQVHYAKLKDGTAVAVKVQYPGVENSVKSDLKILKRIFTFLHFFFPGYGLKKTFQEISSSAVNELDFKNEGKNLEKLAENLKEQVGFAFPKVFWNFSTSRILTLEFIEGIKLNQSNKIFEQKLNPQELATRLIHAFCKQIFIDGCYHADPHPGNFLVQSDGTIVMLDFGAVATISEGMRKGMGHFMEGIIQRDNRVISQALKEMGFIAKVENEELFDRIVEFFYDRLKDLKLEEIKTLNLNSIGNLENLFEFRKLDFSFSDLFKAFNVPKDWALLERTLIILFALVHQLDPALNPLSIAIPYAEEFVLGKNKTFKDLVIEALKEVLLSYWRLPSELQRTLKKLNQGQIQLQANAQQTALTGAIHRLNLTLLLFGSTVLAYFFHKEKIGNPAYPLYGSLLFGGWLILSLLKKR